MNHEPNYTVDELLWQWNVREFETHLKTLCPKISNKYIEKNIIFLELVNEYCEKDIYGMEDFLDRHSYDLVSLKYVPLNGTASIDWDLISKIEQWVYNIAMKMFWEKKAGKKISHYYIVIAQKKNKWWIEGVKNTLMDLLSPKAQESMN